MTAPTRTLFQISDDISALDQLIVEIDGEINDEQTEAALDSFFAELGAERDTKIDGYCSLIKHFGAIAEARKTEAHRLTTLAETDANNAKRLKTRLLQFLQLHNIAKLETLRFKIARQNNGGSVPVLLSEQAQMHPEELPEKYRKVVFQPRLDVIREDLERLAAMPDTLDEFLDLHTDLDGLATLGERGEHLRIR